MDKDRRECKGRRFCFWGTELLKCFAALAIIHQDGLMKRINRIMAIWRKGCFGKMNDHLVHTILNHYPIPKWMFSQKRLFKSFCC